MDLVGTYINFIRQHQPSSAFVNNNVSLACMTMINPATGWLEIFEVTAYDLNEVTGGND